MSIEDQASLNVLPNTTKVICFGVRKSLLFENLKFGKQLIYNYADYWTGDTLIIALLQLLYCKSILFVHYGTLLISHEVLS